MRGAPTEFEINALWLESKWFKGKELMTDTGEIKEVTLFHQVCTVSECVYPQLGKHALTLRRSAFELIFYCEGFGNAEVCLPENNDEANVMRWSRKGYDCASNIHEKACVVGSVVFPGQRCYTVKHGPTFFSLEELLSELCILCTFTSFSFCND